jgi:hypothetical protein
MNVKEMTAIVTAVALTVVAAHEVRSTDAARNPWLRNAVPVHGALPPGHPAITGRRLPPGHPPVESDLPPGHPPIPWAQPGCPGPYLDEGIDAGFDRDERTVIST